MMTNYEKIHVARRDLEKLRAELIASLNTQKDRDPDLLILHERVSKAIAPFKFTIERHWLLTSKQHQLSILIHQQNSAAPQKLQSEWPDWPASISCVF